eukprot:11692-Prorocentrum_lima.AAC.1
MQSQAPGLGLGSLAGEVSQTRPQGCDPVGVAGGPGLLWHQRFSCSDEHKCELGRSPAAPQLAAPLPGCPHAGIGAGRIHPPAAQEASLPHCP